MPDQKLDQREQFQEELFDSSPKVTLIEFTGKGRHDEMWHAADILLFTKSTRLNLSTGLLQEIQRKSPSQKREELVAMARTIPSSWEFIDVTFLIEGVTRACAQQMTRTRTGSYAMQSQRVVDVSDAGVRNPIMKGPAKKSFAEAIKNIIADYTGLLDMGVPLQDARGVLPMNIQCNLCAKYNFRSFVDLIQARSSLRTQDEYAEIITQMYNAVIRQWPWSAIFFVEKHEAAITILEGVVKRLNMTTGSGDAWEIAKAIDLLRKG